MSFYYIESYKNEGSCDFLNNNKYQTQSCIVRMLSNLSKLPYYKEISKISNYFYVEIFPQASIMLTKEIYIYIYKHIHIYMCMCIYVYI